MRDFAIESALVAGDTSTSSQSFAFMARENLVLDFDCEYLNMQAGKKMAESNPNLALVLQHIGFPRSRDWEYFRNWSTAISELAQAC